MNKVDLNKIFYTTNNKIIRAIKNIGMSNYIKNLMQTGPLDHKMNRVGRRTAFTICDTFDDLQSRLREKMTLLIDGDKILDEQMNRMNEWGQVLYINIYQ
jgi:hypothetical protein